ncbi:hypothetical protein O3M35_005688 [Rhynocoris fuscipes]|uniref:Carboxylesterase type B domain-containing protein n=1 Tax=Rhynocoris fuscipes TaxID=488301 RepID=A0AAW1DJ48_9HEMI
METPLAMGDVMAALRWIKENIGSFGGDPKRVTLMGHDTGAALANLLLISPQAKGLIIYYYNYGYFLIIYPRYLELL